jgi:hypothetical protein
MPVLMPCTLAHTMFGARTNATNSVDDIAEMVKYAHLFKAKVFVTVNTILYDNELDSLSATHLGFVQHRCGCSYHTGHGHPGNGPSAYPASRQYTGQ